ncbi:phenylalanine--tRNA ligase subunit alpha [Candidatus Gottesmanbacteria bacterium RIFCSPLOWO2_02_FULL_42_29]|uniref:Phenylalanine--tRNA ligase alpha subunit n=2 Tax=Candidatus Gottesmaniibacteriota TaxID=1752720 RepID=A0A1F6BBA8_9BACT|nr:MAG: Phenylalanine-tRNA ligase alpha subunit [Candidatus Gottesmanbacteria bacterium GW2011_GWA2_42_18]OGG10751.1 MAG: phenylalanine--tRNA ligase subunit alpha [Candidatus Gottesmanbacteria bacterium RIFCSPHIGHO2_01_FULL_42_27]OGG21914.1 MAG: phenylalanine--tRNA ligase subunit alpha [Candidatus Gottesmanbacteria bacterium RIFCSPHIGHO2_12_FULL_43_26]OGG34190.1 MAG: phenylalanine--tRNA ligase subunit alpha [Candidatus Gottesmanbacteria bacterium RIFCSPLOWO2_01_FULL_42_22]OGG35944.1 MAG: phenyl
MEKKLQEIADKTKKTLSEIKTSTALDELYLKIFGSSGEFTLLFKSLTEIPKEERPKIGKLANQLKQESEREIQKKRAELAKEQLSEKIDVTFPAILPPQGHLHIITQAIEEIVSIFKKIGFNLRHYPEVEWDWYSFESLNMPKNHPARDDFETFYIDSPPSPKYGQVVLSPHTSSGQVREMESLKGTPPIRMINIAKCYRPNWDLTHTPMFHQFEGLVIDSGINITHLKGTLDYFAREFFGPDRLTRLRPFHFQFTEPSFEVDINCGICLGKSKLANGENCRFCKSGWLELGGAGMVHPNVLKAGKIDPKKYSGFAFGWGVERTYMMKSGTQLNDIRLLYGNDIRFLEQF